MTLRLVIILAMLTGLTGCSGYSGYDWLFGKKKEESATPPPPAPKKEEPKPEKEGAKHESYVNKTLMSHIQYHKYYDCKGKLTKKEKQVVEKPIASITVHPQKNIPIDRSSFKNLNNGELAGRPPLQDLKVFVIAPESAWYYMGVQEGENKIEYTYENCGVWSAPDVNGSKTCQRWDLQERDIIVVNVTIVKKDEDVHHKAENCP